MQPVPPKLTQTLCYALAHDSNLSTSHVLSYLKNSEPKPSGRPPRYKEQNVKNDERNCRAVGRATRHGIMKQKLSADTKRFKEVRQRALEANLDI